jgi:pantoate--beta-alanine ligase
MVVFRTRHIASETSMQIIHSVAEIQRWSFIEHMNGNTIGFVPTMGALHEGHAHLFSCSKGVHSRTVVSIFVNPLQFNNKSDLEAYPRQLEQDIEIAKDQNVDVLFTPSHDEMYPSGFASTVSAGDIAQHMEGLHRPGHFDGVATVVVKLLNAVTPDVAYFGEKDFQQVSVIRQVVRDLNLACEIASVSTVREQSGLAMSSRNVRLSTPCLEEAAQIFVLLKEIVDSCRTQGTTSESVRNRFTSKLESRTSARVEYVEIVDSVSLQPVVVANRGDTICVAVWFDDVRLIDNVTI